MGQGGYGVNQAFLWYMRDGRSLRHDIHVFAFIAADFERMRSRSFLGYRKPTLALEDERIVVRGTPVPASALAPLLNQISGLRTVVALNGLAASVRPPLADDIDLQRVVFRTFEELQAVNAEGGSLLVLVYLPTSEDYVGTRYNSWRRELAAQAARRGLAFIDLVEAFRRRSLLDVQTMFIADGLVNHVAAAGHYTKSGNAFVARSLLAELIDLPEVQTKLAVLPTRQAGR
jgi:hypothetical protein